MTIASTTIPVPAGPRARIALAGTVLQICLGTVYAWSFFQKPLAETYGWTSAQVTWAFSTAIALLGLSAAWAGSQLPRFGPRRLAIAGGLLYGLGHLLAAVALHVRSLPLLVLGYGVVGGIGLGFGYVTPVATVARWYPDRKGLATGIVIMGFGLGALLLSKVVAPALLRVSGGHLVAVFAGLGVILGGIAAAAGSVLRNPPTGATAGPAAAEAGDGGAGRFALLWLVFFFNILAGIQLIGFQSPLFQDLAHRANPGRSAAELAAAGATLIAISSIFNGLGRMLWGGLSDRIGRMTAFRLMLGSQALVFLALAGVRSPVLFGALVCYILLCYGGGFGTMPALALDTFGPARMARAYGALLTAWSAAGVLGPQILARLRDAHGPAAAPRAFQMAAALLAAGFVLALAIRPRAHRA
jgi:OFA family oxalate/formate antiporter-like MFS transporter